MTKLLSSYATPFITGLFVVSLVSGVALFLHWGPGGFHAMHEWLSMLLILPFGLHLWKNWRPMMTYFKRLPMLVALAASLGGAAVFLLPSGETAVAGGPPQFRLAHTVLGQPLSDVAPAVGLDVTALTARLAAAGFSVSGPSQPLSDIAATSGNSEADLAAALVTEAE